MTEATHTGTNGDAPENTGDNAVTVDTPKLRKAIQAAVKKITDLRAQRTDINADIQSELESLAAKGIPKEALKRAIRDADADEDKRAQNDQAFVIVRAALGKPTQVDAFRTTTTPPTCVGACMGGSPVVACSSNPVSPWFRLRGYVHRIATLDDEGGALRFDSTDVRTARALLDDDDTRVRVGEP